MIKKRSVDADSSSRLFAYVLDWAIGGILTGLPAVVMYAMITKRDDMFSDLYVFEALGFNKYIGIVAGLLCFVVAILYFIVIPYKKFNGQTLGKKLTKIKIESVDGTEVSLKQYMIRYCIIFIFECPMFIISTYIMQMMTI
ncbi:MAG: RDD family protein, partial [Floccifex sp.]